MLKKLIVISTLIGLSGCSSVLSVENPTGATNHGLGYFMPKKDFLVTINVSYQQLLNTSISSPPNAPNQVPIPSTPYAKYLPASSKSPAIVSVALGTTETYPDLAKRYVLKHGMNAFGRSIINVGINEKGLLGSVKSVMKSGISNIVKNNKMSKNNNKSIPKPELMASSDKNCSTEGKYTFIYKTAGVYKACGITITITKYAEAVNHSRHAIKENTAASGVFYRQNEPYLMKALGKNIKAANIVFSPSASNVHFLPVSRTFFAKNSTNFAFNDGVAIQYQQGTDGEIVSLFKLPADILHAYFSAVGSVFNSFRSDPLKIEEGGADNEAISSPKYINPRDVDNPIR